VVDASKTYKISRKSQTNESKGASVNDEKASQPLADHAVVPIEGLAIPVWIRRFNDQQANATSH
jgi:hypothetical protein